MVVAEPGQCPSLVVEEQVHLAAGSDDRDRLQLRVAGVHDEERAQRLRDRLGRSGQRLVDLEVALCHGQLEVPAGIRPSGTAAQADPCRGQSEVRGVEVRRLELEDVPALNCVHPGKLVERWQVCLDADGVRVLDLVLVICHGQRFYQAQMTRSALISETASACSTVGTPRRGWSRAPASKPNYAFTVSDTDLEHIEVDAFTPAACVTWGVDIHFEASGKGGAVPDPHTGKSGTKALYAAA